jgi:hypothetical protein
MAAVHSTILSLQQLFSPHMIAVEEVDDKIVVKNFPENSSTLTKQKIQKILEQSGVPCSITGRRDQGFKLTILSTPSFQTKDLPQPDTTELVPAMDRLTLSGEKTSFRLEEITSLLNQTLFRTKISKRETFDKWREVNFTRSIVTTAFNKVLEETLLSLMSESVREHKDIPIIEIGTGVGYTVSSVLASRLVRIQPGLEECYAFRRKSADPLYCTDIEGFCHQLVAKEKRAPFIFALDVFDTMRPEERKKNLVRLAQLQEKGDKIVILLDTTPLLDEMFRHLKERFSAIYNLPLVPLPYLPLTLDTPQKYSVILMPEENVPRGFTFHDFISMRMAFLRALIEGTPMKQHRQLHEFKDAFYRNGIFLPVLSLEDYFVSELSQQFEEIGYMTKSFYRHAFTTGSLPSSIPPSPKPLFYRSVTDIFDFKSRDLDDPELKRFFAEKQLEMPVFDEEFLRDVRTKKQKVLGAELLVVEATKN